MILTAAAILMAAGLSQVLSVTEKPGENKNSLNQIKKDGESRQERNLQTAQTSSAFYYTQQ